MNIWLVNHCDKRSPRCVDLKNIFLSRSIKTCALSFRKTLLDMPLSERLARCRRLPIAPSPAIRGEKQPSVIKLVGGRSFRSIEEGSDKSRENPSKEPKPHCSGHEMVENMKMSLA